MNELITPVVTVLMAIIGVAMLATLVSKNANTTGVIKASSNAFNTGLGTALSPVTGGGGYQITGNFNTGF